MNDLLSYRHILKLCLPLMGSMLATTIIHVTDTAFVGRIGEVELGAAAIGGVYYLMLMMCGLGLSIGAQILMARADGENNPAAIGPLAVQCTMIIAGLASGMILLHFIIGRPIIGHFITSAAVHEAAMEYLKYRVPGLLPLYLGFAFRAFHAGTSRTSVIGQSAAAMALSNIALNYMLVFGHFGMPRMGIGGAALASSLSEAINLIYMVVYTWFFVNRKQYGLDRLITGGWQKANELMSISAPIMIQMTVSLMSWFFFFMIIEGMGERPLALSNVVRGVYSVLMVPLIGISHGTQTLVSNLIGQGRSADIWILLKRLLKLSVGISVAVALINLLNPSILLGIFTSDSSLRVDALPIVYVISITMVIFAIGSILLSAVSGTGRTLATLVIEVLTLSVYLAYTYYIVNVMHGSLLLAWTSEAIYFVLLAALSAYYLKSGRWNTPHQHAT